MEGRDEEPYTRIYQNRHIRVIDALVSSSRPSDFSKNTAQPPLTVYRISRINIV